MPRLYKKSKKVGLPPGTLLASDVGQQTLHMRLIDYDSHNYKEMELKTIEECFGFKDTASITWINVDGKDVETLRKVDEHFGIHPLVLEDIINSGQRPKIEDYDDYIFIVLKMIYFDEKINDMYAEQVGLILGQNFVLSFQEKEGDVFSSVRQRIHEGKGRIRHMGSDYLVYALLDAIVDHYFVVLERIGEQIDHLEKDVLSELSDSIPLKVHQLKTQIIFLRKQIWPLREVIAGFMRVESNLFQKATGLFIRDVYDHTIQVNDTLEAFRDALSGIHDIYLSSISNRMNDIMKVLTIFAAIFIPLTFVAGIYGMNFENMPELKWPHGYFVALTIMFLMGLGMLLYFKKNKWL